MTTTANLILRRAPHYAAAIAALDEFAPTPSTLTDIGLAYASAQCDALELQWLEFGREQLRLDRSPSAGVFRLEIIYRSIEITSGLCLRPRERQPQPTVTWPLDAQDDYAREFQKDTDEYRQEIGEVAL